ncbi:MULTISPECIES: hypothetical protein [unclassified Rhizobium]|uniref:hypothetical protein n=1 Tax=unclassified Rhizobium TaxID=2613769 RepID=UPI0007138E07|nr:hypothetical protein [Rhizobium sp. Leaf453]KQS93808.1 hypothetical protein ASG50_06750 [Rhizobium sp. Leaf386]KQT06676.1 hypothetical protein ASG42_03635 [Rhizobium sp. Leaf391]KQU05105.1 hypothetical protein ASG68_26495 [Rhizobium sp. Leaf453]
MKSVRAPLMATLALALAGLTAGVSSAAPPDAGCTCRKRDGTKAELGQMTCIRVGDDVYLARCEMALNVTTWRRLRDGCPEARMSVGVFSAVR